MRRLAVLGAVLGIVAVWRWANRQHTRVEDSRLEWAHLGLYLTLPPGFVQSARAANTPVPEGTSSVWRPVSPGASHVRFVSTRQAGWQTRPEVVFPLIEVTVDEQPEYGNLAAALALVQRLTYGPSYRQRRADFTFLGGHAWLRTEYQYDVASEKITPSQTGVVEYALRWQNKLYRVGFHGWPDASYAQIERVMSDIRFVAQHENAVQGERARVSDAYTTIEQAMMYPATVTEAAANVVIIAVGTVEDAHLRVTSGGSGTVVSPNGAVLSNLHVIVDEGREELYDVFFVGRQNGNDGALEFLCAGRPANGVFREDADLALLRCDRDLQGTALSSRIWPSAPRVKIRTPEQGSRVFVVGYPDANTARLTISVGAITGWDESVKKNVRYLRTDAGISAGVSGGAVFSADGELLGVPTAYRFRASWQASRSGVQLERVGLIGPIALAQGLLEQATDGWAIERTPRTP